MYRFVVEKWSVMLVYTSGRESITHPWVPTATIPPTSDYKSRK
jgi:hypothetical protein